VILLDTNVISALMQRDPERVVVAWLDRQAPESVWTSAVTVFEIRFGLALLEPGRRRRQLDERFTQLLAEDLEGRVLPFDQASAESAGAMAAGRRRAGRTIEHRDVQIAGIAAARNAALATRNTRHFVGLGVPIINPWAG
jgi:toxin FitB